MPTCKACSGGALAAARGRLTLRLRVKGGNHPAREFYARAGYREYEVELEKQVDG
jgi:hypothetical protein